MLLSSMPLSRMTPLSKTPSRAMTPLKPRMPPPPAVGKPPPLSVCPCTSPTQHHQSCRLPRSPPRSPPLSRLSYNSRQPTRLPGSLTFSNRRSKCFLALCRGPMQKAISRSWTVSATNFHPPIWPVSSDGTNWREHSASQLPPRMYSSHPTMSWPAWSTSISVWLISRQPMTFAWRRRSRPGGMQFSHARAS